ncbi:UNVERIFIED_ORG: hypothetical protein BDK47_1352 [Anoxybacillus amylolyticus]
MKNAIIRWTDRYFPEFWTVLRDLGKTALSVLEWTPLPANMADRTAEELIEVCRQSEGLKCPQKAKIQALIDAAKDSIGVTEGTTMARFEIALRSPRSSANTVNWKPRSRRWMRS